MKRGLEREEQEWRTSTKDRGNEKLEPWPTRPMMTGGEQQRIHIMSITVFAMHLSD